MGFPSFHESAVPAMFNSPLSGWQTFGRSLPRLFRAPHQYRNAARHTRMVADFERKSAILRQSARHPVGKLNCLGVAPGPGPRLVCSLPDVFPLPSRTFLLMLLEGRTDADFLSGSAWHPTQRQTPSNPHQSRYRIWIHASATLNHPLGTPNKWPTDLEGQ